MAVASLVVKVEAQVATFQKQFAEASRSAQKFEKDFANSASSVTAQQKRISDAFASFSGDKLTREATAVAKAVEQIGGAARLTAGEQGRVNSQMREAIAKYQALGQTAPKAMLDLAAATAKVPAQLSLADRAMGVLSSSFSQFTAANLAANAIGAVTTKVGEFVSQGLQLRAVELSFNRLATAAHESSAEMLSALQGGTRGLVSNLDLMQAANKALLLGLPVTSGELGELARSATVLGRAMGQDATKSLDDLITALGRSSPLILDNLGLTVKVGEANETYARSIGKTADQLTQAEQKTAFYQAAMEAARLRTKELGDSSKTLGEVITTAWTAIGNRATSAVSFYNTSIGHVLTSTANLKKFGEDLQDFGLVVALHNARKAADDLKKSQTGGAAAAQQSAIVTRNWATELKRAAETMPVLTKAGLAQYDAAKKLGATTEELTTQFGLSAVQQQLLADQQVKAVERTKAAVAALKDEARELVARVDTETTARAKLQLWMGKNQAALNDFSTKVATEQLAIQLRQLDASTKAMFEFEDAIRGVGVTMRSGFDGLRLPGAVDLSTLKPPVLPATFLKQMFNPAQMGIALGNAISSAIQGGGNVLNAAAGTLGQGFTTRFAGFLTGAKSAGGLAIGGFLGGAINAVLPGVGALLGPLVGKITSKIAEAFGGPSKGELEGRGIVAQFEQQLQGTLSAATRLEAGNESWKLTTIAVRDAYIAAGRSALEAEAAVAKLWASSRGGADSARLAVLEIQAVMDAAASRQQRLNDAVTDTMEVNLDGLGSSASDAAREIEEALKHIRIEPIRIPIEVPSVPQISMDFPAFAQGGIVRRPTLALIGEAGPEAVVPLSGSSAGAVPSMAPIVTQVYLEGREIAEAVVPHIPHVVRRRT